MTRRLVRLTQTAFLLSWLMPAVANGQTPYASKLDESLRETLDRGCTGAQSVIIRIRPGYREGLRASLAAHGDVVTGEFPGIDAIAATVHCSDLTTLASFHAARSVSSNAAVSGQAAAGVAQKPSKTDAPNAVHRREREGNAAKDLQAPFFETLGLKTSPKKIKVADIGAAWGDFGSTTITNTTQTGWTPNSHATSSTAGIGIAIIDSGIEPGIDFDNRITAFYDFTNGSIKAANPSDGYGHGTHVSGLIASRFVGIAPTARLIGLKVLDVQGRGDTANVVRAIEFAVANKAHLNIQILNISLGHPIFESAASDPLVQAVEHAVRAGLHVVVSAGNFGINPRTGQPGYAGMASPANSPSAVTVGAVQTFGTVRREDDRVAPFSSRGPSWYDGFAKPDVVAPGHNMLSVAAVGSKLRQEQEKRGNTGDYMRLSGTSMSAGVASGVVALVLQTNRGLTPNALKAILEYSSILVANDAGGVYDALTQGAGGINAAGSIALASAINSSASVGSLWLTSHVIRSTFIGQTAYPWAQRIVWGNHIARGVDILSEQRPAWAAAIVWGEGLGDDDNIVWGNNFSDDDNIVWGNRYDDDDNIVWGDDIVWGANDDNIVWGNNDDNIVWGNNIVWSDCLIGFVLDDDNIVWGNLFDDDNIVWGNLDDDNVVWGNLFDDDNIVWGNDDDNIVWGNLLDDDNIVWGNGANLGSVMRWGGGVVGAHASNSRARRTRVQAEEGVR
jgi:serine protease AprX